MSSPVELGVFFLIGLLGGAHCLGMCGPLITLYSKRMEKTPELSFPRKMKQMVTFHVGRAMSYAIVGGLLGTAGQFLYWTMDVIQWAHTVRGLVGIGVGTTIMITGVSYLLHASPVSLLPDMGGSWFSRVVETLKHQLDGWSRDGRIGLLGSLHAFLPCPILYPAFLYALGRGDPLEGFLSMGVLGLGTTPALLLYGVFLSNMSLSRRIVMHRVMGVLFVLLGYLAFSMGLRSLGWPVPTVMPPFYQPLS